MLQTLLRWLHGLRPVALYTVAAVAAAVENVFPPLPSDVVVAFSAFAAARGRGSAAGAFAAALVGNVAGAMLMYAVGARVGSRAVLRRFGAGDAQERKLREWYGRRGLVAIAASRLLPGVRAIVPPVAGALGVGAVRSAAAMALPSALWYGAITYVAFTAGGDFDALLARVGAGQRWATIGAGVALVGAGAAWWRHRRRARSTA
ncbi:membrane protein [Gemmatimonadetes bacterium T265]|nr:membrane protein [Gemmatimonadetes bacterium T265]